jgi:hypothetical protein
MDYQVVLSPSARADVRDIVRYISADDPERALEFGRFLIREPNCSRSRRSWAESCQSLMIRLFVKLLFEHIGLFTALIIPKNESRSFVFGMPRATVPTLANEG